MKTVFDKIYDTVKKIPYGKVATYGQIALLSGNPRWAYALHSNPNPDEIPCYRVVNRNGETASSFAFGGGEAQRMLLEMEGVEFDENGKIDLKKYGWKVGYYD